MLDDDERHEMLMAAGQGGMKAFDVICTDEGVQALRDLDDALEAFTTTLLDQGLEYAAVGSVLGGLVTKFVIDGRG